MYRPVLQKVNRKCVFVPLYINELDTINSLLHHKNMSGEVRISDSLLLSLHNERTKLSVSCRSQVVQGATKVKMIWIDINL